MELNQIRSADSSSCSMDDKSVYFLQQSFFSPVLHGHLQSLAHSQPWPQAVLHVQSREENWNHQKYFFELSLPNSPCPHFSQTMFSVLIFTFRLSLDSRRECFCAFNLYATTYIHVRAESIFSTRRSVSCAKSFECRRAHNHDERTLIDNLFTHITTICWVIRSALLFDFRAIS